MDIVGELVSFCIGIDINEVYISQSPLAEERQEVTHVLFRAWPISSMALHICLTATAIMS